MCKEEGINIDLKFQDSIGNLDSPSQSVAVFAMPPHEEPRRVLSLICCCGGVDK